MVNTSSSSKLISWVDYSLFHSSDLNWVKGSIAIALCVHGWALRIVVEFVPPIGLLYFLVHCGLAVGALLSLVLLAPPLIQDTMNAWSERMVPVECGFLLGMLLLLFTSLSASFQYQPWFYYEIIPTALMIYGAGRHWISRKKKMVSNALPIDSSRIERCNRVDPNGAVSRLPLVDLKIGDEIKISTGQVIPVDGVVVQGQGFVSESSLNGSTFPIVKQAGDPIFAGSVSQDGVFTLKTLASYVPRKIQSVENPLLHKEICGRSYRMGILRASSLVGVLAVFALVLGLWRIGLYPTLVQVSSVLIVGCSLVLVSGVPVHYWTGLVHLAKRKLYGRSPQFVDEMASINHVFFGKTGVITRNELKLGTFFVMPIFQDREDWIMSLVYQTSRLVHHPLVNALSGVEALIDGEPVVEDLRYKIISGSGVEVTLTDGLGHRVKLRIGVKDYIIGKAGEARLKAILEEHDLVSGQRIWISLDGRLCAIAQLKESWNVSPQPFFAQMEYLGVRPGILTGDSMFNDSRLEGLTFEKGLSSLEKQSYVEEVVKNDGKVLYVGDGLNDFRAMNASSISIALQHAPDPLLASASAILGSNNLPAVLFSIPYCRRIARLTKRNEWFFLSATTLFSFGAVAGWLTPRVAISVLLGAYLIVWFQSYILGSSILSGVKKRARRRISLKETQANLAPHRNH